MPLLRDDQPEPPLRAIGNAFDGITMWPTGGTDDETRRQAQQSLIATAATWTARDLHDFRDAFVAMIRFPDRTSLEGGLSSVFLALKTAFPRATLDVLRIHGRTVSDPLAIRAMTMMPLMDFPSVSALLSQELSDEWSDYYLFRPEPYYELIANLGFPRTFGFGVRFGPELYLIVDYGQDVQLDPAEWSERRARDVGSILYSRDGSELRTRSFPDTTLPTRHFLRAWITQRLNHLYAHIFHLHAVTDDNKHVIDTAAIWKDLLTLRDIVALTQIVATSSDPSVIRLAFFDLIDRYGQLGGRPKRIASRILCKEFIETLAMGFDERLGTLRETMKTYLTDAWRQFVVDMWAGVREGDARDARVLNVGAPGEPPEVLVGDELASRYAWVLRNTTHGYHLDSRAFEKYLVRHKGTVPDSVRELALGLWLALMSSPRHFWPKTSRFEGMAMVSFEVPDLFRNAVPVRTESPAS